MAKQDTSGSPRTRNWSAIVYPESAPENWRDILDDEHIEWVESPIHDKDLDPTGEPKKPHVHILLLFGGPKTYEQVLELLKPLNCTIPVKCHNAKSLVRYFAHLDNPDKHQYGINEIKVHGGVDLSDLLKPSASERYGYIAEMQIYVKKNNIMEIQDLMDYAREQRYDDWHPVLCDSTFAIDKYIKSQRHRGCSISKVNVETGEILTDTP